MRSETTLIVGAGPAGLTAAYELAKAGRHVVVLEADPQNVGGISRTVSHRGFRFDIGGHRFFSKSPEVTALWREILPHDFLSRPRASRILYRGKLFSYPIRPVEALLRLGPVESLRCVLSYARAKWFPARRPRTFTDWVTNQFGSRLFEIFFRTYTEKVWGMACEDISSDWAAQRIRGLSLGRAIVYALLPKRRGGAIVKTLIDEFHYPRLGPGQLWEECAAKIGRLGGEVRRGCRVVEVTPVDDGWRVRLQNGETLEGRHLVSTAPMRETALALPVSERAKEAARGLRYRDFITVALMLRAKKDLFPDNWIYVHDPGVKVGRIQNFKSWSPEMVPDPATDCLGLEYFCFEGDGLWESSDDALIRLAKDELTKLGLAREGDVFDGCVVRQPKAYPIYDEHYAERVAVLRGELEGTYPTLHLIGRNGMHKYNNQDHAMMTAMLTARNIIAGRRVHDVWRVNDDAEYHEGIVPRSVPRRVVA